MRPQLLLRVALGALLAFMAMQAGVSRPIASSAVVADAHALAIGIGDALTVTTGDVGHRRAGDLVSARKSAGGSRSVAESAVVAAASRDTTTAAEPAPVVVSELQQRYEPAARAAATRYGIDPNVFVRQITKESHWDPTAVSPAGARGIAQFMPSTAAWLGVDPFDPIAALDAAAQLDRDNLDTFDGDYALMLAAYNAGLGSVLRYGGIPPFLETQNYVAFILGTDPL